MTAKIQTPLGSWKSPITTSLVLGSAISISDLLLTRNKNLIWLEGRPEESGRNAIVFKNRHDSTTSSGNTNEEVLKDKKLNARTRVHEYGGTSFAITDKEDSLIFSSMSGPLFKVERIEKSLEWGNPIQISPTSEVYRYADFTIHPTQSHLLLSILEDHTDDTPANVINSLILLDTITKKQYTLASGNDFYSSPRFSSTGKFVTWIEWSHPDMPWEGSILKVASVNFDPSNGGKIDLEQILIKGSEKRIAGASKGVESVSQPRFTLVGEGEGEKEEKLVFLSDRTGFYELYVWEEGKEVELVLKEPVGHDMGGPDWMIGQSTHAPLSPTEWIGTSKNGNLLLIDLLTKTSSIITTPYISISTLRAISPTSIAVIGSPSRSPTVLAVLTLPSTSSPSTNSEVSVEIIKTSSGAFVDNEYISEGELIKFPTKAVEGESDDQVAYGIYYEPTNKVCTGLMGELPPLVVHCHGGPTSSASRGLAWGIQYFTSRGFAYVDVDYGGSTSYGRNYRKRLEKNWGLVDVNDTIASVEYLVKLGKVDPKRVAITGGSAGGFTVLAALCAGKVFGAGTSLYGVSDLALLAGDTHKFESQYLYGLLGGTPAEVPSVYHDRSPINNASSISAPLLILQGEDDKVVPPAQAQTIYEVIKSRGGICDIVLFEGEGHGFRKSENKKISMEKELEWYRTTFKIEGGKE